jgi:hypothetical protein
MRATSPQPGPLLRLHTPLLSESALQLRPQNTPPPPLRIIESRETVTQQQLHQLQRRLGEPPPPHPRPQLPPYLLLSDWEGVTFLEAGCRFS